MSPSRGGLRARLAEAEETLRAIRSGEVDAVVVEGKRGPQVFTLEGAEHAYRVLIESMNEGALTLTADKTILYANEHFARMVQSPLEQVTGSSFRRFLSAEDRFALRPLFRKAGASGETILLTLNVADGSRMPVQISIRPLARTGPNHATIGMVVTDLTEARRAEESLRALTHRMLQAQEAERGRVALELHDGITQLLCAILLYSQALVDGLPANGGPLKEKAVKLRDIAGRTADEVERISRDLRPSVLENLGLIAALRDAGQAFSERTGISFKLAGTAPDARLSLDAERALYRILQEALRNVEKHARAGHVAVRLSLKDEVLQFAIRDDGIGLAPERPSPKEKNKARLSSGMGLLGMRERAASVGGTFKTKSPARGTGTEIEVCIPLSPAATTPPV